LIGDGPLKDEVIKAIDEEKISDQVVLTGLRRDAAQMMAAMDVFLLTSLWEGLPRVIPQAMCMGLPVVCYQIDGIKEIIEPGKTGYLFPPGNINDMANACIELLINEKLRETFKVNGKNFAINEFNIDHMIDNISNLYLQHISLLRNT